MTQRLSLTSIPALDGVSQSDNSSTFTPRSCVRNIPVPEPRQMNEPTSPNSLPALTSETSSEVSTATTEASPLGDPGPDSITELFERYPEVTADQARKVIAHLRATRGKIGQDQKPIKEKKVAAAKPTNSKKLSAEELAELLGDLS